MADGVDLGFAFDKPPEAALRYFEEKGFRSAHWNWWDTWEDANARAFVIARTARLDVHQAIRDRLRETLAQGMTERGFIRELTPELQRMGWWGRKIVVDADGNAEVVQEGSPWRLKTIYRTNLHTAYNAGRWKQQKENADSRPYWMYIAVMDAKTRASHAAMHGRVFRHDDPIWDAFYPPCAFNCRCRVRALTAAQVERRGLKVESSAGRLVEVQQDVGIDRRTGELIRRRGWQYTAPDGRTMTPSPGWSYNPGRAAFQPDLDRYDADIARQYVEGSLTGPAFARQWTKWEARVAEVRATHQGISDDAIREMFRSEADPQAFWPVAILSPADRALLGTEAQMVRLSDWTLAKQAISRGGQDVGVQDYWRVQSVVERAQVLLRAADGSAVAFVHIGDHWWQAVIKPTRDRTELYLVSFRRTSRNALGAAMRNGEVLRDARG